MDYHTYVLINGPLVVLNIMTNAFYFFCMVCPLHAERIKQPLKFLLWSLICCTIAYLMSITVMFFSELLPENSKVSQILGLVALCTLSISLTSSVWLNLFFYTQIVPAQRAFFVWIKKNIKPIIYCICLVERTFYLFGCIVMFLNDISLNGFGFSNNFTTHHDILMSVGHHSKWLAYMYIIWDYVVEAYFLICLGVMVMFNGSTVVYLSRHMGRMVAYGHPLSCPRFSGQVRVTVTGILQGVLYVFCNMFIFFSRHSPSLSSNSYIQFTVINLYMSGTTFNLGAGLAVFRRRATDIWIRVTQWCKTPLQQQQHNKEDDTEAQT
ncbi:uncharacterized protein LOC111662722 [Seriola lalandi dorsalis]|uniref:uncharacterized protein LOC111662722 n=1 Tax=Seriola lalandi dorsalis TaxID=1841481 RepID=UPI000C6F75A7|nr:uncharacterized protein LOC111662722 [Seriola lalandi dorsalis]